MTDIVERLREWADPIESGYEVPAAGQVMRVAADYIQQLEIERAKAWYDYTIKEGRSRFSVCDHNPRVFIRHLRGIEDMDGYDPIFELSEGRATELLAERERRAVRWAIRKAASAARDSCLVPPDGGSPTEVEQEAAERACQAVLSVINENNPEFPEGSLPWECPINDPTCTKNCGSYGCGN